MAETTSADTAIDQKPPTIFAKLGPGLLVATVIAFASKFLSEHYGAPAMLMALLLGIAFHFLAKRDAALRASSLPPRRCYGSGWRYLVLELASIY